MEAFKAQAQPCPPRAQALQKERVEDTGGVQVLPLKRLKALGVCQSGSKLGLRNYWHSQEKGP